jgi:hypothetical protein
MEKARGPENGISFKNTSFTKTTTRDLVALVVDADILPTLDRAQTGLCHGRLDEIFGEILDEIPL